MDSVLLDTDVFSYMFNKHTNARLYEPHLAGKLKGISFVSVGELYSGAKMAGWGAARIARLEATLKTIVIVPYDLDVCRAYGALANIKTPQGTRTIASNDRWIAACAIRHGVPLVSHNRQHYEWIPSLTLISEALPTSLI